MTRGRRVALVVAGVGLVGVTGVVVAAIVATRNSDRLLAGLGRGLGREIRAGGVGFSLRGGVGVALEHVSIADDPAFGNEQPFLAADRLAMRLSVLPLLQRRVVVDEVVVERPVVKRSASGRSMCT